MKTYYSHVVFTISIVRQKRSISSLFIFWLDPKSLLLYVYFIWHPFGSRRSTIFQIRWAMLSSFLGSSLDGANLIILHQTFRRESQTESQLLPHKGSL